MKKKFIAAALGMILTICIVALPIIGASADTSTEDYNTYTEFHGAYGENSIYNFEAKESGNPNYISLNVPGTNLNGGTFTLNFFCPERSLLQSGQWITILGYGWNSSGSGSTNIFSSNEVSSTFVKIEKTITFDTTHLVIEIDNNIPITMVLAELSIKLNNQSYGLYNSGIETYINTMKSYTENTEESGENTGFENGINYAKYGVFSGAEVISAKLNYNNWQPSELKIDFINNGISFESLAKQFDDYCIENSIDELGFTITLSTVPFLWTNNNFFVSMSLGFRSMQIYDTNNKAYNVKIGNEQNDFGYNLYATLSEETTTPEKPINKIVISYQSIDYCGMIYNPTGSSYSEGYVDGYNEGQYDGYQNGYYQGSQETYNNAYQNGYNTGYSKGYDQASKDIGNFFGYIAAIGEAPANMIQEMFNFEIMGIDVSTVIFALLTTALVVILLKKFT